MGTFLAGFSLAEQLGIQVLPDFLFFSRLKSGARANGYIADRSGTWKVCHSNLLFTKFALAFSFALQIDVRVRTPTGKALRMSVALPDSSYRVVRELAEIEHKPLELVRVYFKGEQLNHDLMPARADFATHGHKPDYLVTGSLALTMEIAIQVIGATR